MGTRRIIIRREECLSCAACGAVCPTEALLLRSLELVFEEDLCNNCFLCVSACPTGAIVETGGDPAPAGDDSAAQS